MPVWIHGCTIASKAKIKVFKKISSLLQSASPFWATPIQFEKIINIKK